MSQRTEAAFLEFCNSSPSFSPGNEGVAALASLIKAPPLRRTMVERAITEH